MGVFPGHVDDTVGGASGGRDTSGGSSPGGKSGGRLALKSSQ